MKRKPGGHRTQQVAAIDEGPLRASGERACSAEFDALVDAHGTNLVRSLTLITLDTGMAEDAAQEAFLQLHLHWNDPAVKDRIAWLYRVAINRSRDYRRALWRATKVWQRLSEGSDGRAVESWSPDHRLIDILRPLPRRQRTAAALFYLVGFSTREIAEAMGISEGAVGSHLHKAREALRSMWESE